MNQHWKKGLLIASLAGGIALASVPAPAFAATTSENSTLDTADQETKRSGWFGANGKWFYYNPVTGEKVVGWKKIAGKATTSWYYFNQYGVMQVGWKLIDGKYYHFDSDGRMQIGWKMISGKWYFLKDGVMKTGWVKLGGYYYYFSPKTGAAVTGWVKTEGKWYYLSPSDYSMDTGWKTIDGVRYYFDPKSGAMSVGWKKISQDWYYFKANGTAFTGLTKDGNAFYCFDENGEMLTDRTWGNDEYTYYGRRVGYIELGKDGRGKQIKIAVGDEHKWFSLSLNADGSFTGSAGKYQKTEGDGPNNLESHELKGTFSDFKMIGNKGFSMKLKSITDSSPRDEVQVLSEFSKGATFYVYFPGTDKSELVDGFDTEYCQFDNRNRLTNVVIDNPECSSFTPYDGNNTFL